MTENLNLAASHCSRCGAEYREGFGVCADDGTPLLPGPKPPPEQIKLEESENRYLWLRLLVVLAAVAAVLASPLFVEAMSLLPSLLLLAVVTPPFLLYLFAYKSLVGSAVLGVLLMAALFAGLASLPAPAPPDTLGVVVSNSRLWWPLSFWVIAAIGLWLDLWARLGDD